MGAKVNYVVVRTDGIKLGARHFKKGESIPQGRGGFSAGAIEKQLRLKHIKEAPASKPGGDS